MNDPKQRDSQGNKAVDPENINLELEELKARFLSITAHEFKTPLTGILSSLNLIDRYLKSDPSNWARFKHHEKVSNHLNKIQESATNLSSILNKFLSIRNIEKGEIPLKMATVDLKNDLSRHTEQFQSVCKPNQVIRYTHLSKTKRVILDKYLLRNIMNNLLSNAVKFSSPGSVIRLTSSVEAASICISIEDEGIGIPPAEQQKVFQQFYRAANAKISEEGTGLGLYIVQRYIQRLGGRIELKSQVNKGTTIDIILPNHPIHEKDPDH